MGVAATRAPVDNWGPRPPQKLDMGTRLLGNCYFENKFHKSIRVNPPLAFHCHRALVKINMRIAVILSPISKPFRS